MQTSNKLCNSDEFTLYVNDLPPELDKHGINRIFSRFGTVKSVLAPEGVQFAFVVYSTYGEAEAAINSLDNQPPFNLKVNFRKQKVQNAVNNSSKLNDVAPSSLTKVEIQDFRYSKPTISTNSSMQYRDLSQLRLPKEKLSAHRYHMDPNGYVPNSDCIAYNPYDDLDYPSTNAMWTRGCLSIDAAGRRYISMGRGHTIYRIPDPCPSIEKHIAKVYEVRNPGCYTCGTNQLEAYLDKCMLCSRDAILICTLCKGYYCTRECQVKDWPKHQYVCKQIPPLRYATGNGTVSISTSDNTLNKTSTSKLSNDHQRIEMDPNSKIPSRSINKIQTITHDNKNNNQFKLREPHQETLKKSTMNLSNRLQNARLHDIKAVNDDNDFQFERTFLSKINFIEVQIVDVLKPGLYSVQKSSDMDKLGDLMKKLNKRANELPVVSKIIVGKIYAARYDDIWHRALILSQNPLKVDYIDYGTITVVKNIEFRELGDLAELPRFSQIIKLSSSARDKFKSLIEECTLNVKMININDDGAINVEVMNSNDTVIKSQEILQPVSTSQSSIRQPKSMINTEPKKEEMSMIEKSDDDLPSILDVLTVGMGEVVAGMMEKIDDYTMTAVLIFKAAEDNFQSLIFPLKEECDAALLKYNNYRPRVNELVCARKYDELWVRGRVIEVSPTIKIASLDEGLIIDAKEIIPIVPRYKEIYTFAVVISTANKFPVKSNSQVPLKIINREKINDEIIVKGKIYYEGFEHTDGIDVDIKKWVVNNKCDSVKKLMLIGLELKNNSQVMIQAHRSTSIVFLRSLDEADVEQYCRLTQDVAKASQISKTLSSMPSLGDLVLAEYIDGNYYRAIVLAINNNDIKLGYIDYGNNEVTKLNKLKEMPESLKEFPRVSARVTLKGIQNVPPTEEAINYLGMLAAKEMPLVCIFDDDIDDGVVLISATGESVNDFINDLLTPSHKKEHDNDEDENYLRLSDMEMGILGYIGDTTMVCLLDTFEAGVKYVFAPLDNELISHISRVLPNLLKEYCETANKYIPRANELCIARFEDGWYRGCCVKPSLSPTTAEIYFLDFGNVSEVNHDDIRMMQKDYLKPAALGCICTVSGFISSSCNQNPKLKAKLETLLIPNEQYKIKILNYNDMEWSIELPEIRKKLVQEGLISP